MIDDIIKTLKANLYERAFSPLLGTFIFSWCLWNYRFLIVLFSSLPPVEKINSIDTIIFNSNFNIWFIGLIGPLISTLVLIFIYPYPAKWVYGFWRKRQNELKSIRQKIENETPLTIEESRKMRSEIYILKNQYEKQLEERDLAIQSLQSTIDAINAEKGEGAFNSASNEIIEQSKGKMHSEFLDEDMDKILQYLAKNDQTFELHLFREFEMPRVKMQYHLDELLSKKYIIKEHDNNRNAFYKLLSKGRKYLVQNNLI
jgi:predicted transcriptional regulator